jgi:hypothetical protein
MAIVVIVLVVIDGKAGGSALESQKCLGHGSTMRHRHGSVAAVPSRYRRGV